MVRGNRGRRLFLFQGVQKGAACGLLCWKRN